ncbi:hypothetical protein Tco_0775233 [Tanacetum coccineum]
MEQAAKISFQRKSSVYYSDNDDDEEYYIPINRSSPIAITPDLPTVEPDDSLIMGDEHLSTIPDTKSDKVIKSSVENLVPIPSESGAISDGECDLPICDSSPKSNLVTHSNPLFDSNDNFTSSDDESFSKEDVTMEEFKICSNPLFDFDEANPIFDEVLENNSSPRPPKELNCENSIESFSLSPIPVEDSDFLMKEIDVFLASDGSMPPGIDSDGSNSEGDNLFIERLLYDDPIPLPEYDHFHFNNEPTHPTLDSDFIHSSDFLGSDLLVSFPSETRNKTFDPGIFIEVQSKRFLSLNFTSHRGFKAFKINPNFLNESPMMIYGGNNPILDVPISPDYETSCARGFVLRSLELHILSFILGIQYPNLID